MQICEKCKSPFKWGEMIRTYWWVHRPLICNHCQTKHHITNLGRVAVMAMSIVPLWVFGHFFSPFHHFLASAGFGVAVGLIGFLLTPFVVKYTMEKK